MGVEIMLLQRGEFVLRCVVLRVLERGLLILSVGVDVASADPRLRRACSSMGKSALEAVGS